MLVGWQEYLQMNQILQNVILKKNVKNRFKTYEENAKRNITG